MNILELFNELEVFDPQNQKRILSLVSDPNNIQAFPFKCEFAGFTLEGNTNNLIDRSLYYLGSYEPNVLRMIADVLQARPSSEFLDIGANRGIHSLWASQFAAQVYAVEPLGLVREQLSQTILANKISNISLFEEALGEVSEERAFYLSDLSNLGTSSFEFNSGIHEAEKFEIKKIRPAIDFVRGLQPQNLALIKIDTEGFETDILRSLRLLILEHRSHLIFEYSPTTHQKMDDELRTYLKQNFRLRYFKTTTDPTCPLPDWDFNIFANVLAEPLIRKGQ